MGYASKDNENPVQMLASEWANGYRKFVCIMCRCKPYLLEPVMHAIGHAQGAILEHLWLNDKIHSPTVPSEEEIYEVHNLCKEWRAGQKKFVISLCMANATLFNTLMSFLGEEEGQDLLHTWMVDNLKLGGDIPLL